MCRILVYPHCPGRLAALDSMPLGLIDRSGDVSLVECCCMSSRGVAGPPQVLVVFCWFSLIKTAATCLHS